MGTPASGTSGVGTPASGTSGGGHLPLGLLVCEPVSETLGGEHLPLLMDPYGFSCASGSISWQ